MKRLAVTFIIFIILFIATPANASELKAEPRNFQLQAIPGDNLVENVLITNLSASNKTLKLSWSVPKNNGIGFVSFEKSDLVLTPNATNPIEIEFKIPKDLQPADYYGSLVAKTGSIEEKSDFTIRILGTTKEEIAVEKFHDSGSKLNFEVSNNGNRTITLQTKAKIEELFGLFGKNLESKTELKAGEKKEISIAHSNLPPGFYGADVVLLYGTAGREHLFPYFWVNPDFALIGTLLLVIVVLLYFKFRKSTKHD
ncbi:MAG: hypothetical protein A2172_02440 [Candidatus Woykebacteria bacterium RBG_13_40_15]|uniref:CARDB domain-containing protein n=1 Tax=Candidatus Woykebacteria bacterium RBG_13_40_15 TaxID=1802593 RepID=A0A1G1W6C7_9BACT|nr:MAG: hypothetical protein A2172_02440 [Candidatus Woykebacteria bacterium RBG_13_40_15]